MRHHSRHKIQASIQPTRLPPLHTLLPCITPLPCDRLPPPIRPLTQNERILRLVLAQLKPRIINDVILLHHIRLQQLAPPRRLLAQNLHLGIEIRMRGRGQALQDARLGEDHGARADGHEGALFGGVGGLEFGEGLDEGEGFGGGGEDGRDAGGAAGDDEDVVVF